jgi:nucleotide-binding universal stress UspA family protein
MLAVFERIDLSLLEAILAAASGESSLQLVTFTNQPPSKGRSVPDGRISARFAYWFEVKTARNALAAHQLREHLANLGDDGGDERLFVVTPDAQQPDAIADVNDPRLVWFSFRSLHDAVDEAVNDPRGTASEQARFLLRELQALVVEDGLVDSDEVVVVAARFAYPEYLTRSVYVCQAKRTFRGGLTHLGFYANGAIQRHVPSIRHREDLVTFTPQEAASRRSGSEVDRRVGEVIQMLLADGPREEGEQYQVFLLSGPEDPDTVRLDRPIANDTVTESGRSWAWTLGQRYVSLADLTRPGVVVTSQLGAG